MGSVILGGPLIIIGIIVYSGGFNIATCTAFGIGFAIIPVIGSLINSFFPSLCSTLGSIPTYGGALIALFGVYMLFRK